MEAKLSDILADPCVLFEAMYGFPPHDYQRWLLNHSMLDGQRLCILLGRRLGKSKTLACKALHEALSAAERGIRILILSPSKKQSEFIYTPIRDGLRTIPALISLCKTYEKQYHKLDDSQERLQIPIRGARGLSTITCASGDNNRMTGRWLVGDTADIAIYDEAALITAGTVEKTRKCTRTGRYRTQILSGTPRAEQGIYYDACRPVDDDWETSWNTVYQSANGWTVLHRDSEHAPHIGGDPIIWDEVQAEMAESDEEDNLTEEYARFVSTSGKWFNRTDVKNAIADVDHWSEYAREYPIILGIDLGLEDDPAVAVYGAYIGDSLTICHIDAFLRNPDPRTPVIRTSSKADIVRHIALLRDGGLRPVKVYADTTNDPTFLDMLRAENFHAEGVHWCAKKKGELMEWLRDCLRSQRITLPRPDTFSVGYHARQLVQQLIAYTYHYSEQGNVILNVREDTSRRRKSWADDYCSATSLCAQYLASYQNSRPIFKIGKERKWGSLVQSNPSSREMEYLTA